MPIRPQRFFVKAQRGFTLVELVVVIILLGILSVTALPRLSGSSAFSEAGFHAEVLAALHYAQKTAVSHRRLVCAEIAASSVTLRIASGNPSAACTTGNSALLRAPDGTDAFASSTSSTLAPTTTLHFQPDGRITSDAAGTTVLSTSLAVTGMPAITIQGATGYVK